MIGQEPRQRGGGRLVRDVGEPRRHARARASGANATSSGSSMRAARRLAGSAGGAAGVIECSIRLATIGSPRDRAALVEAVDIAAVIELRDEARVVEILRLVQPHLAIIVDFHHLLDALDRRIGLARQLRRLGIDLGLLGRIGDAVPFAIAAKAAALSVFSSAIASTVDLTKRAAASWFFASQTSPH